ncbi:putative amidohydrolase [Litorivivens lipolytica]|uniref:Omega-amidase YafV n=1 Tax=Litorivivens lipolytica TaxID=1524264 RepID=A0A7W4W6T0_9GAMM|nr:amidohydrolase [Litorivivens lipolytica]MBB3048502.1 putative amidohydrolase [Litorivivens lipolytica]
MKVAALQTVLYWQDAEKNRAYFSELIADNADVDLIVLPEMFTTGFSMQPELIAEPADGPTLPWLQSLAAQHDCAITGSVAVADKGHYVNRMYWVSPDGHCHYDKRHLFRMAGEHEHYQPGSERKIVEYKGLRFCLQVCYDLRFPVFSRNRNDYDVLIYVANWPEPRRHAWSSLLTARAIENLSFVIGVNRVGEDGNGIPYSGDSAIIDFKGQPLASSRPHEPESLRATLDKTELMAFREKFPAHLDADDFSLKG